MSSVSTGSVLLDATLLDSCVCSVLSVFGVFDDAAVGSVVIVSELSRNRV